MNQMEIFKNPEFGSIRTFEQDGKVLIVDDFLAVGKAMKRFSLVARSEGTAGTETGGNTPESEAPASAGNTDSRPERTVCIYVNSDFRIILVELYKILYVVGLKEYVKIYTTDEAKPILSLLSLKSLEEMLPEGQFIRVHRSFIVQGSKIKMIDRNRIVFGKEYIPISDTYKESFAEFIARHSPIAGKPQG